MPHHVKTLRNGCYCESGLVLEKTTKLSPVVDRRVLALLDEQNLSVSARYLGYRLDYGLLVERMRSASERIRPHIFTAAQPGDDHKARQLSEFGYIVHVKTVRRTQLRGGHIRRDSDIDNLFSFWAGKCASRNGFDAIVLGSGDYGLSGELAQAIAERRGPGLVRIVTLSLPGSTSRGLDARKNPHIASNMEIGLDVLKPLNSSRLFCPGAPGSVVRSSWRSPESPK